MRFLLSNQINTIRTNNQTNKHTNTHTNNNRDLIIYIYSGVRVIASRILQEICLLIGELAIRRTSLYNSYSKTNDLLQTAIHSILDH